VSKRGEAVTQRQRRRKGLRRVVSVSLNAAACDALARLAGKDSRSAVVERLILAAVEKMDRATSEAGFSQPDPQSIG